MDKNTRTLVAIAFLSLPAAASAHNYSYVEGGFISRDAEDSDRDSGFRMSGSFDFAPPFAAIVEYSDTGDTSLFSAGGLYHQPVNELLDVTLGATAERADTRHDSDWGFGLRGGLRWQVLDDLEIAPELRYLYVFDESLTSGRVGAVYRFAQNLDATGAVQVGDDDRFEVGLRYDFGPWKTGR